MTSPFPLLLVLVATFAFQAVAVGSEAPQHLRAERLEMPMGIDARQPRLSWWVGDQSPGAVQTAYEVAVASDAADFSSAWTSGKVVSDQSVDVVYAGPALKAGTRYFWRVRTWDRAGEPSAWSETAWFETGLFDDAAWTDSRWIAHPERDTKKNVPAPYFRVEFDAAKPVKSARLYATARGLYLASINGRRVGDDYFTPGWTDYRKRNQYLTYDVTDYVRAGRNALGAILGEGWYSGYLVYKNQKNHYGTEPSLRLRLVLTYVDGTEQVVATDEKWKVTTGPIRYADFYQGENYDARLDLGKWSEPGYDDSKWTAVRIMPDDAATFTGKISQPIRVIETLEPKTVSRAKNGEWVFDFGQNMVGVARFRLSGKAGQTVVLHFAEMLNADGTLYLDNLRTAHATIYYTFAKDGEVEWQPNFTYNGFRYVGLSGVDGEPTLATLRGLVLHNDMPETGRFTCSNPMVNQLQSNILWGQRGNFVEVPTDCPQRDERLGWTGDAQIFVKTAAFNYDVSAFFEKWTMDMRDAQKPDGQVTDIVPAVMWKTSAAAWGDAMVICPWTIYQQLGDRKILADNYDAMKRWVDWQDKTAKDGIRPRHGYGDWLALDKPNAKDAGDTGTPKELVGTAYLARVADLLSRSAEALGKTADAAHYRALHDKVRAAFQKRFISADGRVEGDTQTGYLLALGFDLMPENLRATATDRLVADIKGRGWHLSTGFVGTGILMPTLDEIGRQDVAFRLLLQDTYPSWLYSIKQGATTMWERWNSYTKDGGFGPVAMNSFNHYAYGAIGEWMYAVIGGLRAIEPGFKKSLIKPVPGGDITSADCSLDTPYGPLSANWKIADDKFRLTAVVPANTTAVVELPDGKRHEVAAGRHEFEAAAR